MGLGEELQKLGTLRDEGTISEDEFREAKRVLLASPDPAATRRPWNLGALSQRARVLTAAGLAVLVAGVATWALWPDDGAVPSGDDRADSGATASHEECQGWADELSAQMLSNAEMNVRLADRGCREWLDSFNTGALPSGMESADPADTFEEETEEEWLDPDLVQIKEWGWTPMVDDAIGSWGAVLENPNTIAADVTLTAHQIDEDGVILESYDESVTLPPESETVVGDTIPLGFSNPQVELKLTSVEESNRYEPAVASVVVEIKNKDEFSSEVTLTVTPDRELSKWCDLFAIFRDKNQKIVGGATIDDAPIFAGGQPTKFRPSANNDVFIPESTRTATGGINLSTC